MEALAPLMAIGIMIYGLMLMGRGPTFANRMVGRALGGLWRVARRELRRLLRLWWRLEWALLRAVARGLWWVIRRTGRLIRTAWRRYPRSSGLFWGALAGASVTLLVINL